MAQTTRILYARFDAAGVPDFQRTSDGLPLEQVKAAADKLAADGYRITGFSTTETLNACPASITDDAARLAYLEHETARVQAIAEDRLRQFCQRQGLPAPAIFSARRTDAGTTVRSGRLAGQAHVNTLLTVTTSLITVDRVASAAAALAPFRSMFAAALAPAASIPVAASAPSNGTPAAVAPAKAL